jgi:aminoglycoside phosphotransferase (APT) family kinase protein
MAKTSGASAEAVDALDVPGIDRASVSAWLSATLGLQPPLSFTRIGQGQSNLTCAVEDVAGHRVVIRRPPLGELARGAHDMVREHRILSALGTGRVPTARSLAISTDPAVTGATVYSMEYVDGIVLHTDESARALAPQARSRVGVAAVEALAAVHRIDVDDVGLGDLGRRDHYAERQLRGWSRQWEATRTRELELVEQIARTLNARIPPQRDVALVHGDYNLANLIVGPDGEVRAILDWELSTLGDPVADLGTLLCYWPDGPEQAIPERDPLPLLAGFSSRQGLIDAYARAAPERDLSGLQFWLTLATWKLAIIFEGITRRRLENPGNSPTRPEMLRRTTEHLAELAASLI